MILWIFAPAGCAAYRDPTITVTSARLVELSDEAAAIRIGLDLHNPNNEALTLLDFKYDVSINGTRVYRGIRAGETVLAIQGDKHLEIPGVVRYDEIGWSKGTIPATAQFSLAGRLKYITPGKIVQILFDTGVRRPSVGFRGSGEVDLTQRTASR